MELDHQILFRLHVHSCTHWLRPPCNSTYGTLLERVKYSTPSYRTKKKGLQKMDIFVQFPSGPIVAKLLCFPFVLNQQGNICNKNTERKTL